MSPQRFTGHGATSGLAELDAVLGGIYWGDNVLWEYEQHESVAPFFRAIAQDTSGYHFAGYVTMTEPPDAIRARYPLLEVIDARPGSDLAQPGALLTAIRRACRRFENDLLLFDPLDRMAELWGVETARRFYTRCCPLLLDLGAVAYWPLSSGASAALRRTVAQVAQCVIALGGGRLRILKADGRPPRVEGTVMGYRLADGQPALADAPVITRLGSALRAVRDERGMSQTDVARLVGISPSAVSQAERGKRGLSLETLLDLTAKLGISLDDLLRGQTAPGYRLARRHDPLRRGDERPLPLLDDPSVGMRAYLVRLRPDSAGLPDVEHKGVEMVAVADGLVQVTLSSAGLPVLREGEVLVADRSRILGWRNLGAGEAMFFWVIRDVRRAADR